MKLKRNLKLKEVEDLVKIHAELSSIIKNHETLKDLCGDELAKISKEDIYYHNIDAVRRAFDKLDSIIKEIT